MKQLIIDAQMSLGTT